ncbi:HMG box-containing protein 4 isoform X2 [Scaptodrosophila lebanonensis]|uniref:HMG box-containing protein 4 isoform X2 n=1 Tax=Drosophila lebanonensis TaxID=7225 RepID=A0A6J2U4I9_DROLE|nr:HMG box-containing protein 4 isoform X2 [Scaptodrosophila lebanonensis]
METPILNTADFQVAGVSRSGRVRKKSSKLLDFESPEEIEKKTKRQVRQPPRYHGRGRPPNALREREHEPNFEEPVSETESQSPMPGDVRGILMNSDDELDTLVQDLVDGVEAEATNQSRVRQSLYMREKTNKRKILKDGKLVTGKMQRKDKGKSRYTAYSLWARDVRKRDFQDLDFANAARRLSELWANVSNKDKNAWRRKAKIQATKARSREKATPPGNANNAAPVIPSNGNVPDSLFMNRATTSRTKKLAAERRQPPDTNDSTNSKPPNSRRNTTNRGRANAAAVGGGQPYTSAGGSKQGTSISTGMEVDIATTAKGTHVSSIEAIDAAAHLKLLGESLTVIGERLKEHNGHVALSGSLSVLLDSLLCSMGPLLCMTTQIPGLENKTQLCKNLATTLDNIAYVMPGL